MPALTSVESPTSVPAAGTAARVWERQVTGGRIALAAATIALWQIALAIAGPSYMAGPFDVADRLMSMLRSGSLAPHVLATLRVSAVGLVGGGLAGIVLPLALWPFPRLLAGVEPIVVASAGIPKYALVPLFVLWLGIDEGPKFWLTGLLVFYPIFGAVVAGASAIEQRLVDMARVIGAGRLEVIRFVIWPAMFSFVFASFRIAVPRAFSAAIVGELLVGGQGVGYLIESARQSLDIVGVFSGVTVATALVLIPAAAVRRVERRVLSWRPTEPGVSA